MQYKEAQWKTLHAKFFQRATAVLVRYGQPDLVDQLNYIENPSDARDLFILMVLPEIEARGLDNAVQLFLEQNSAVLKAHRRLYDEFSDEAKGFLSAAYKVFA